jgi:predicted rRNA pseudouridine synthase
MTSSLTETGAEELDGFIIIDKPKGPTSHQVDHWVREILGTDKVGHIGTLDPNVSGVLVMAIGKATKLIEIAHEATKEYVGVMRVYSDVTEDQIKEVFKEFTTEIYQIPPMRSAVARSLRKRRIHSIELMEMQGRLILFRVRCDSGTYIRTLCTDIGYALGTGAQMSELRRISSGPFTEEGINTLQDLKDAVKLRNEGKERLFNKIFLTPDYLFREYSKVVVKSSAIENIAHGSDLFPGGIVAIIGNPIRGERVCAVSEKNELVGTGKMLVSADNIGDLKVVDFDRVFVEPSQTKKKPKEKKPPASKHSIKIPEKRRKERKQKETFQKKGKGERAFREGGRQEKRKVRPKNEKGQHGR